MKRYFGQPYCIGFDVKNSQATALEQLRLLAERTAIADKQAEPKKIQHPKAVKRSPNRLRRALDELK